MKIKSKNPCLTISQRDEIYQAIYDLVEYIDDFNDLDLAISNTAEKIITIFGT